MLSLVIFSTGGTESQPLVETILRIPKYFRKPVPSFRRPDHCVLDLANPMRLQESSVEGQQCMVVNQILRS